MIFRANALRMTFRRVALFVDRLSRTHSRLARYAHSVLSALLLSAIQIQSVHAQSGQGQAPLIVLSAPRVDALDENRVSIFSGRAQFTIPALKLGDVSFVPYSYNGQHFAKGGVIDHNYGRIVLCKGVLPSAGGYAGSFPCVIGGTSSYGIQVIYGEERSTFSGGNSNYFPMSGDGSTFIDNGSTCTWTKRDGTQIVYVAYHESGNPLCQSNNISKIIYPDGRIATYYYYGSFSTIGGSWSPILSIATNSGYLLKYNYSGTPKFGSETSVTAINRAFETCDPAALSCSLSNSWPTAALTFVDKTVTPSDGFPSISPTYSGTRHYIFTIEEASHRKHIFELDSYSRVISYQPPEATTPQYTYALCSNLVNDGLRNCFGWTHWSHFAPYDVPPLHFDAVESVTHNGQIWQYGASFTTASLPYNSTWWRLAYDPRGGVRDAKGNATPGTESLYGGNVVTMSTRDGTIMGFAWSASNEPISVLTPAGIKTQYGYGARWNLETVTRNPVANTGMPVIVQSAIYPATCSNPKTCNKPTAIIDANSNQTDFTYDPAHGGTLTTTFPAVAGGRPETRYSYVQRKAWYLGSDGVMAGDANSIWVLATESVCVAGAGCTMVTTYDYGPDSGPNNLLVRGKAVVADSVTQRSCYGHDKRGNKIWETSPNANPSSCPAY